MWITFPWFTIFLTIHRIFLFDNAVYTLFVQLWRAYRNSWVVPLFWLLIINFTWTKLERSLLRLYTTIDSTSLSLSLSLCVYFDFCVNILFEYTFNVHAPQSILPILTLCKSDAPFLLMIELCAKNFSFVQTSINEMFTLTVEQLESGIHRRMCVCTFALHASMHWQVTNYEFLIIINHHQRQHRVAVCLLV